ncbi:hypothetical protein [Ensifer sp. ENS12]|uniref:hypothetical protein n=1 Tax=Ensifer sp. ENS12 TaxID=2854774 RepID=UPI000DE1D098|nr:hypothetical protein [Ensifer sp. ENS12]MBV7518879.1 hypothetical protein [Ensifer sp. ENS12]
MPAQGTAGFSLAETLVALSVFSLLTMVLLGAIQQIRPLYQASKSATSRTELNTIADFLDETIAGAVPLVIIGSEQSGERLAFVGSQTSMRFVGTVRVGSEQVGLREISISYLPDKSELLLEATLRRPAKPEPTVVHIARIDDARFEYLSEREPEGGSVWQGAWSKPDTLPTAIRMTIGGASKDPALAVRRTIFLRNASYSLRRSAS